MSNGSLAGWAFPKDRNIGNPYPPTAKVLNFPEKKDTRLGKNGAVKLKHHGMVCFGLDYAPLSKFLPPSRKLRKRGKTWFRSRTPLTPP